MKVWSEKEFNCDSLKLLHKTNLSIVICREEFLDNDDE